MFQKQYIFLHAAKEEFISKSHCFVLCSSQPKCIKKNLTVAFKFTQPKLPPADVYSAGSQAGLLSSNVLDIWSHNIQCFQCVSMGVSIFNAADK